ncbi:MAG: formate dehydrogenase subunit gamma [Candidatus Nitrospinota bacterium M3_3B_026]
MRKTVIRFNRSERWFHNIVMFTFLFLLITGLAMLYYNLKGDQGSSRQFLVFTHKIASVIFIGGPILALLFGCRRTWIENIKVITSFSRDDIRWLTLKPLAAFSKKIKLPRDDKFNPGQKVWIYIAVSGSAVLAVTGVIMWVTGSPILALAIHTVVAVLMIIPLGGHIYMATLNPETRPGFGSIVDGEVNAEWAMEHHPIWMERTAKQRVKEKLQREVSARRKMYYNKTKSEKPESYDLGGIIKLPTKPETA